MLGKLFWRKYTGNKFNLPIFFSTICEEQIHNKNKRTLCFRESYFLIDLTSQSNIIILYIVTIIV